MPEILRIYLSGAIRNIKKVSCIFRIKNERYWAFFYVAWSIPRKDEITYIVMY